MKGRVLGVGHFVGDEDLLQSQRDLSPDGRREHAVDNGCISTEVLIPS